MKDPAALAITGSPNIESPIKVLYVSGATRTSSTLLGRILNEVEGFVYVGETVGLWRIIHNHWQLRCGCGELLLECPLWKPVLLAQPPPGQSLSTFAPVVMKWLNSSFRARHTWSLLRKSDADIKRDPSISSYLSLMESTYRSLHAATAARVLVDTSKAPGPAAGLTRLPGLLPFVVHLVRDPRAVAYSWGQNKEGLERYGIVHSATEWARLTAASDAVARSIPGSSMVLRYEDFMAEPARSVAAILTMMGEDSVANPVHGRRVTLGPNHSAFGNPNRFENGEVEIRLDRRWETAMPRHQALAVKALVYPFMRRYGYA